MEIVTTRNTSRHASAYNEKDKRPKFLFIYVLFFFGKVWGAMGEKRSYFCKSVYKFTSMLRVVLTWM
jgi:hypothetical protein